MKYVDGGTLDTEWDSYTPLQKRGCVEQLKSYLDELRSVSGTFIGSVDGSRCEDQFFDNSPELSGPFQSMNAFHNGLIKALRASGQSAWTDMVIRFIETLPQYRIVLTHNDLAPRNIIIRDGTVLAIVDWEFAGFHPDYWEYVGSLCWANWQSSFIKEGVLDQILQSCLIELAYMQHARNILW